MLFRLLSILLVVGSQVTFVVSQSFAPPEILVAKDPDAILQPLVGRPADEDADGVTDDSKVIRGLLGIRQDSCPNGYAACNDGGCCPAGGACCGGRKCCANGRWCYGNGCCRTSESGCEGNSCCRSSQTCCKGGGCCNPGWYCDVVNGVRGCCKSGRSCESDDENAVCTNDGYVPCTGENFCCPADYECYRDATGSPKCREHVISSRTASGSGFSSTPRPTGTPRPANTPASSGGGTNSAATSEGSFNIFGIAPLLGWIAYVL